MGVNSYIFARLETKLITLPVQDMLLFTPNSGLMVTKKALLPEEKVICLNAWLYP